MNFLLKAFFFVLLFSSTQLFSQANFISKDNFRAELILLKSHLEHHHANLYVFRSPQDIHAKIDSILSELPNQISILEAYAHVSFLASYIQDGHALIYPSDRILNEFYTNGPLIPFDLFYDADELFIVADYSNENKIPLGAKIISINGETVESLYQFMLPRLPRDGDNMQYSKHIFYKFFPAYYSFFYGFTDSFKIEYIDQKQNIQTSLIKGITRNEIKLKKEKRGLDSQKAIHLKIDEENNVATIRISSFDKKLLKNDFKQRFRKEIRIAFREINSKNIDKLVIDLRDNQGGDLGNGAFLLKHLGQTKIDFIHSLSKLKIDKKTKKRKLKKELNLYTFKLSPKANSFKGRIYLLTNGGSFSCSAIVANAFKKAELGLIIGETTGGSSSINGGSPTKLVTLPYTKILVTIPKTQFILNDPKAIQSEGVIPDIEVKDHYGRFLGEEDLFMLEVLKN